MRPWIVGFAAILFIVIAGCAESDPISHPFETPPSNGGAWPQAKYVIIVSHGIGPNGYHAFERYHTDIVQYKDNWVIFRDKTLNTNIHAPASSSTVIGGDEPILPYIKSE